MVVGWRICTLGTYHLKIDIEFLLHEIIKFRVRVRTLLKLDDVVFQWKYIKHRNRAAPL